MSEVCELCGTTENLQGHHISYNPEIKQTLCIDCHQLQHPNHGVGRAKGSFLFDKLKNEFIIESDEGRVSWTTVAKKLGISCMTACTWGKKLGIKRCRIGGRYIKDPDFAVLCLLTELIIEVPNLNDETRISMTKVHNMLMRYKHE